MYRRRSRHPAHSAALALIAAGLLGCQPAPPPADEVSEPPPRDLLADLATQTDQAEEKILGLARAIPEEDYMWRPASGVRSVAEVLIHIAADNYFLPLLMGVEVPAPTGITLDFATVQAYQDRDIPKEQIVAELEESFRFLDGAMAETRGDLNRPFEFGGTEFEVGSMWVMAITHLHEHLGQMIAYARSNDVTPPWSMPAG
ncbi:MAG: DinB family protein [Longimicrobiales bacterium]